MITRDKFEEIKEKYGYWSSWAIWAEAGDTPKSNVGDLSVFEGDEFLDALNINYVLVGLNIARADTYDDEIICTFILSCFREELALIKKLKND